MDKKGQAINKIVVLVIALIVIAIMAFLAYKYILGTGEQIGGFASCKANNGTCVAKDATCAGKMFYHLGCPETAADRSANKEYCCVIS